MIGGFSWMDLVWLAASTVRWQVSDYSQLSDYNWTERLVKNEAADAPITFEEIVMVMIKRGIALVHEVISFRIYVNTTTIVKLYQCFLLCHFKVFSKPLSPTNNIITVFSFFFLFLFTYAIQGKFAAWRVNSTLNFTWKTDIDFPQWLNLSIIFPYSPCEDIICIGGDNSPYITYLPTWYHNLQP